MKNHKKTAFELKQEQTAKQQREEALGIKQILQSIQKNGTPPDYEFYGGAQTLPPMNKPSLPDDWGQLIQPGQIFRTSSSAGSMLHYDGTSWSNFYLDPLSKEAETFLNYLHKINF